MIKFSAKTSTTTPHLPQLVPGTMTGWYDLPVDYDREEFARIKQAAAKINSDSKYLVCIGIGGSYLGHRAVIEALGNTSNTKILYAGNSLSPTELEKTLDEIKDHDFSINVISKSGTTTEPAIAFRILKAKLIEKYGEQEAARRIYATTDQDRGALHDEAAANHYQTFTVPDNIGGRYSVLTAVGLLPIAAAGISIDDLMQGAAEEREAQKTTKSAANYAATRLALYQQNFAIEILATFEPAMSYFNEWWKQLAGESEGKDQKGIFPASLIYSTDLHSMGQYLQDGPRHMFETIYSFSHSTSVISVPHAPNDQDGLSYLEGKKLSQINQKAQEATIEAHAAGGVPILEITAPELNAKSLGALIYFFELAIATSAKLLGVDPFNQPGVEAYKNNMFRLLGKPGHEG